MPEDVVEITAEEHQALLAAQAAGQRITAGEDGRPVATDPPALTTDKLAALVRAERDKHIDAVAWRVERYHRQVRLGLSPTDSISALDAYIQTLCDLPTTWANFPGTGPDDPDCPWPVEPGA